MTRDHMRGESYSFAHRSGDLIASGIWASKFAPEWARDAERLWNRALESEIVKDRNTGELRFRRNAGGEAQVAMAYVIALPKELTDDQNIELLARYIDHRFSPSGVAVQWAIHRDDSGTGNVHAHLLVTTRALNPHGFNKTKARELNPKFVHGRIAEHEKSTLKNEWRDFQNAFFREKGLDLEVDPERAIPGVRMAGARYVAESEREAHQAALAERQREVARNDTLTIAHLTKNAPTFTARTLESYLQKSGLSDGEVFERRNAVLANENVVRLEERRELPNREILILERFTTQEVLEQERTTLEAALRLGGRSGPVLDEKRRQMALEGRELTTEQRAAFEWATAPNSLVVVKGRAGTGKSYTVDPIRTAYEQQGQRVIGLAPTNTVAADMGRAGFKEASTVAAELMRQESGYRSWDSRTVVIVDEAAMVSANDMGRVLAHADSTGAKVILVGDERQLQSVERGGLFEEIANRVGAAELRQVYRQKEQWAKEASQMAAQGHLDDAVRMYDERGAVRWSDQSEAARSQLVNEWSVEAASGELPVVYASTNAAVDELNRQLRAQRIELGQIDPTNERTFSTMRGDVETETTAAVGDRVMFNATVKDRAEGLHLRNGEAGTIEKIDGDRLTVRTDNGRTVEFDASERRGWALGYASTVYKGQGKTNQKVMALYDNPHVWRANTSYVALTRHKDELRIYAGRDVGHDIDAMGRLMSRDPGGRSASSFLIAREQAPVPMKSPELGRVSPDQRRAVYEAVRQQTAAERAAETPDQRRAAYEAARQQAAAERAPETPDQRRAAYEAARERFEREAPTWDRDHGWER